jgi:molybdate transport system ATP-binding protein
MIEVNIQKRLQSPSGLLNLSVNFSVEEGQIAGVYGASGAGKTSLLRYIAGLSKPDNGRIICSGDVWYDKSKKINIPSQRRKVGMVFQDYSLFPNMSVKKNLEYALKKGADPSVIHDLIEVMELGDLRDQKPESLSGGQKQRVSLARALVTDQPLLLLDEPLSALDRKTRIVLQDYLIEFNKLTGTTIILVSHDVSEVARMSDVVLVLEQGEISRKGSPSELFSQFSFNSKFQFTGEVISIEPLDVVFSVTVLIGKDLVKVVADDTVAFSLNIGDQVMVAAKAFNPVIQKIG